MIEFLLTPIGIWVGVMVLTGAVFMVGAILSLMNSLFGEMLAFVSAIVMGVVGVVGLLPALYFTGTEWFEAMAGVYAIVFLFGLLFVFVMSAAGSSRGY